MVNCVIQHPLFFTTRVALFIQEFFAHPQGIANYRITALSVLARNKLVFSTALFLSAMSVRARVFNKN